MTRLQCRPSAVRAADPAADLLLEVLAVVDQTAEQAGLLLVVADHPPDKMAALAALLLAVVDPADRAAAALRQNRLLPNKSVCSAPGLIKAPNNRAGTRPPSGATLPEVAAPTDGIPPSAVGIFP